jgi:hypothetical protein
MDMVKMANVEALGCHRWRSGDRDGIDRHE